jgi:6-phosphogluconolactonase
VPAEPQIKVFDSAAELSRGAAEEFCRIGAEAIGKHGRFTVALSGGSTPRTLHQELATTFCSKLPWDKVYFFWGDERHVPPDFPESNFRMAKETLLSHLSVPARNVFRMHGELPDAEQAAQLYQENLREVFRPSPGEFPRFDFIVLGVGPDGHTASLFPGTKAVEEHQRWVVGNWVEQHSTFRVTLTYPVLNHAANVMFLMRGTGKAEIVYRVLRNPSANLPSQKVQLIDGNLMWYLDKGAAARL